MATLRTENQVRDYEAWKAVFDKFERFRAERNVRSYRVCRDAADPSNVSVELDFDSVEDAITFKGALEQIWATPQSQEQLISHATPKLYELAESKVLTPLSA